MDHGDDISSEIHVSKRRRWKDLGIGFAILALLPPAVFAEDLIQVGLDSFELALVAAAWGMLGGVVSMGAAQWRRISRGERP